MNSLPFEILFEVLGNRIRDLRQSKKLSQIEVAARCGLDVSNYNKIEFNKRPPSLRTLFKIAIALDEPISNFFNDEVFLSFIEEHVKA